VLIVLCLKRGAVYDVHGGIVRVEIASDKPVSLEFRRKGRESFGSAVETGRPEEKIGARGIVVFEGLHSFELFRELLLVIVHVVLDFGDLGETDISDLTLEEKTERMCR